MPPWVCGSHLGVKVEKRLVKNAALASPGTELMALTRGRETPVVTAALPLVPHRYIRG